MRNLFDQFIITVANAQSGPPAKLVPCKGSDCDWNALFALFNNILVWFIWAAVPAATIVIAYAGWLMIWHADNESKVSEAKSLLWKVLVGLAAVLAAALIVKAILQFLTKPDFGLQDFIQ